MRSIVVGAGVAGLSCAYELSELGHDVTVVDAGPVGAGASAGNAGWVTPFLSSPRAAPGAVADGIRSFTTRGGPARLRPHLEPGFAGFITRFLLASRTRRHSRSVAALQKLASQAIAGFDSLLERGVSFEHYTAGLAVVFAETAGLTHYQQDLVPRMRRLGYVGDTEVYRGGAEISEFDPAIRRDLAGVLHLQNERHVRPETLTQGLAKALLNNSGAVVENEAVIRIEPRPAGTWTVTTEQGRALECEHLVLAAGFPTRALLRQVGVRLPMEAAKGTSLTAQGTGTAPRHPLKFYERMVACSPFGSSVRLSGTFDLGVRDHQLSPKRLNDVVTQGLSYLHDWRPDRVETRWVGHRPTTSDDLPVIGPVHGQRGLYLCTGHGTLGVTLGPVTAALAAREIAGHGAEPLLEPFRLSRF